MKTTEELTIEALIRKLVREELQVELAKQPPPKPPTRYVSVAEYAKARSICISTVRNAIRSGRLPAMKIGAAMRVPSDAEIGIRVTSSLETPTPSQIAERIISKEHKRRLVSI